ncbi:MAG: tRNA 2-thiouridine(34) synthase MnmA [Lachnospiraceae bacterium]|nr:tRNA 2-thiouridine(34) synthase MnmA [Lachnospiraceae bacterium]
MKDGRAVTSVAAFRHLNEKKALIAMSGGVDSSVSAYLMQQAGYECIGCTMRLYDYEIVGKSDMTCCAASDIADARAVAERLSMPHHVLHFEEEFRREVIDRFVQSYEEGKTPNPCIDCNRFLKFGKMLEKADELSCAKIVTGHYARITEENGIFFLRKAADESKDQSYVLYDLKQEDLRRICFPLGELTKEQVRRIAEENGFVNARKHDSQDICFVPDGDYAAVIEAYSGQRPAPGDFVDGEGRVLGRHRGIIHYTCGQRRGLGLSLKEPLYVCEIDPGSNRVILGKNKELFRKDALVRDVNWISGEEPDSPVRAKVKVRYRQKEQPATIQPAGNGAVLVRFDEPQRAITPGQAAVFYDGDIVLGGGRIDKEQQRRT